MKYLILFLLPLCLSAQVERMEPPFWWAGMENDTLQVLLHGKNISEYTVKTPEAQLISTHSVESKNYLFLSFDLSNQDAGEFDIELFIGNDKKLSIPYLLKERIPRPDFESFDSSDVIYLLMPDRFANGNSKNDSHPEVREQPVRSNKDGRHGGDLEGVIKNLDYLESLGVTALWMTPACEDNDPKVSYHTYAQSDVYRIDPRFGTNDNYRRLAQSLHQRKMKLIMDYVTNHWGVEHWMIKDLPTKDWIHQFKKYTNTNHRKEIHSDPYASQTDKKELLEGWFVPTMADLNQQQPLLLKYLIQNAIWWIEYASLDGFRVDTFPYNDPEPMVAWLKAIRQEYPEFNIVGEGWMHNSIHLSYWQENSPIAAIQNFNSHLPSVMDFTLNDALIKAFNERNDHWEGGMTRIYKNLQNDFLYPNINQVLIFAENHDTNRINDYYPEFKDYKRVMSVLLTLRGIPQIYYGSEIGMTGKKEIGDGDIRRDFPGGWPQDSLNAFDPLQRSPKQKQYFDFTQKLLQWRKSATSIHKGKTLHFVPQEDVYVYFRYLKDEAVMVIVNNGTQDESLKLSRFEEGLKGVESGFEIISDRKIDFDKILEIPAETCFIIELSKQYE
ncbi:MAG: glycoside hydrolase family 13 protein [Flavobacteriaceae bacterium]